MYGNIKSSCTISAFALLLLFYAVAHPVYAGNSVSANVNVICPFDVVLGTAPAYIKYTNITMNYSVEALGSCSVGSLNGNISIVSGNGTHILYKRDVNISNIDRSFNSIIVINSNSIAANASGARLFLQGLNTYNFSSKSFTLIQPADIIITNFTLSSGSVNPGSQMILYATLYNKGELASNQILLNMFVTGPYPFNTSYIEPGLPPSESEVVTITLPINATLQSGTYAVSLYAHFNTTGYNFIKGVSNTSTSTYTVSQPAQPHPSSVPNKKSITSLPQLSVVSAPLLISTQEGAASVSQMDFLNSGSAPETINISTTKEFQNVLLISSKNVYIEPKSSLLVDFKFVPNSTMIPGTYVIPINITARVQNGTAETEQEFINFEVYNSSTVRPTITTQVTLSNNTNYASGTIYISAPSNSPIYNMTMATKLPLFVAGNISQIYAYGMPNNITQSNGYYNINWFISYIPAGQSAYAYYTIKNISSQSYLQNVQNILTAQYPQKPQQSNLRIIKIKVPSFYTNETANITVASLYTGTQAQKAYFSLENYGSLSVQNPVRVVNMSPNELAYTSFSITTNSSTGTFLFSLLISGNNINYSYSLPVVVEENPIKSNIPALETIPPVYPQNQIDLQAAEPYALAAIFLLLTIGIIFVILNKRNKSHYSRDRSNELRRLKDQISRDYDDTE